MISEQEILQDVAYARSVIGKSLDRAFSRVVDLKEQNRKGVITPVLEGSFRPFRMKIVLYFTESADSADGERIRHEKILVLSDPRAKNEKSEFFQRLMKSAATMSLVMSAFLEDNEASENVEEQKNFVEPLDIKNKELEG